MVARYGLHPTPYDQIANWAFVDWMLNFGEATIQRQSRSASRFRGLHRHAPEFRRQLTRLRELRIIP